MERGPGGGLEERGGGGLWRRKGWETLGSQTPTKTAGVGGQTAYGAWAGTAHCRIGGRTFVGAALVQALRRSLWRTCSDTVSQRRVAMKVAGLAVWAEALPETKLTDEQVPLSHRPPHS